MNPAFHPSTPFIQEEQTLTRRIFEEKRYTVQGHILPRDAFFPMGKRDWRPTAENAARLISEAETVLTEDIPTLLATD